VVDARADHGAQPRALLKPPEPEPDDEADDDDEEAIGGKDDRADADRALEDLGLRQGLRRAAPEPQREVGEDQQKAEGEKGLRQAPLPEPGEEEAAHHEA